MDYAERCDEAKRLEELWYKKIPKFGNSAAPPPLPEGKFALILADPPWRYDFNVTEDKRAIERQYPTMDTEAICGLSWPDKPGEEAITHELPAADNAVLFLWATAPKLEDALDVIDRWSFVYKTHAVWDKEMIGMGHWFRGQHELLLVATRDVFSPPEDALLVSSVIRSKRGAHSEKPVEVYEILESMFPKLTKRHRLELFARQERPGWTPWGNEIAR